MNLEAQVPASFDATGFRCAANIRINGHSGTEVLSNFPVLLQFNTNLPASAIASSFRPKQGISGLCLEETNELNYELDTWNPSGDSYVWVQIPGFSSVDTVITAYWGKPGMVRPAYTTNGATWSNGYLGVWHLSQPNSINSVGGAPGIAHGNTTVAGFIGGAQYFNTNTFNNYLEVGNLRATNLTIEAWTRRANTTEYGASNIDDVVFRKSGSFQWYQWNVDWNLQLDIYGGSTYKFQHNGILDLPLPNWTYAVVSYDSATGTGRGYINAVNRYTDVKGPNTPAQNNNVCTIGYNSGGSGSYYGSIDEVRLSGVVRSDDWLRACYENQLSPASFMSFEFVPKLSLAAKADGNLVLSWAGTGLVLQVSPVLGPNATWSTNGLPASAVSNGINFVTIPCSAAAAFYRLAIPVKEFALSADPTTMNVAQGMAGTAAITVMPLNGFSNLVSLSASNLPAGVAAYFNPVTAADGSTLTLDVGGAVNVGNSTFYVIGSGGGLTRTLPIVLNVTASTPGNPYFWPPYQPNLNYDFRQDYPTLSAPSNVLNDCAGVVGTVASNWWCFRYGPSKNPLVTAMAWEPMLAKMNRDFAYFRDVMGWPPDKRAKERVLQRHLPLRIRPLHRLGFQHEPGGMDGQHPPQRAGLAHGVALVLSRLFFRPLLHVWRSHRPAKRLCP